MFLTCPDEVIKVIGGTLRSALAQQSFVSALGGNATAFRLGLVDPDCVLYVDLTTQEVRFGSSYDLAPGMVAMNADTAVAICQGRTDLASAIARGEVVVDGEAGPALAMFDSVAALPGLYAAVAQREGRVDLLAS